jgi:hypothetical protein
MFKQAGLIAFSAMAALLPSAVAATRSDQAATTCLPISVATTRGVFTYAIRIEGAPVSCALARAVVRDAADWPPGADDRAAAVGWHCLAGRARASWAVSCSRGRAIVRGYGPAPEHDPIVIAEARLRIGALAPQVTAGLASRRARVDRCALHARELRVDYARSDGATLVLVEGRPTACNNLGVAPTLAVWHVHGSPARLLEFCAPTGCARLIGDYALDWRERGLEITLVTHGLSQRELFAIARSMTPIAA